ncbi:helix-turn-helix transcriptional regulator [Facklamia sp. 7083-14-GEN3]|uniref:ArsR/SmtB family transcription factor n=1 Tax=Facklamia sp. 7083-14-GEN3 TaxID=2973478 RepID=UPI00215C1EBF|nr:metalloregulator ArsR/SmtB family transcription factor [Facklamia sp. 7083-14-GEN3]MCR8969529.1 metalloregulator ArsR/SmtB family transcription factor [Facklamia sp. 7083-14-GEN3]
MQTYGIKSKNLAGYVNVLKLLSHPIRFSIALLLKNNGVMNVSKIQQDLELTQSTVSQHISKLRDAKIVSADRDRTKIYYSLSSDIAKLILETYEKI